MSLHLFAGLRVPDFQAARPWYERLLGEPTFFPHATEAVWTLADDRSVCVVSERMRHGIRGSLARRLQYGRGESLTDCGPRP
jgi:hypothetical protein